jgi:hypothetical protein
MVNRVNRMLAGCESAVMVALQVLILMLVAPSTVTLIVLAFDTLRIRTPTSATSTGCSPWCSARLPSS